MNRREFIGALGAAAACGCRSARALQAKHEHDFSWSYLAHFGMNCWKDQLVQDPAAQVSGRFWYEPSSADYVRFDETLWRRLSGRLEKAGCRPWIWSDYCWKHEEEFLKRMPRSVLQSNWYYNGFNALAV